MRRLLIDGPTELTGEVTISGAKNAALKVMAAALLVKAPVRIRRVPAIADVFLMADVLKALGARVEFADGTLDVDASGDLSEETPYELVRKMRASIQVLGPLLARLGRARVALPGGDAIGQRPIDLHLQGLERLGAKLSIEHGFVEGIAESLHGARVLLEFPSVGATENLIMAAVLAEGTTVIDNAAREPEIQDLIRFLTSSGARIRGTGTPTLEIEGVAELVPVEHEILPDRIEAGTFAIGAAATRGEVTITGIVPDHLELPLQKLEAAGAEVLRGSDYVTVRMSRRPEPLDLVTLPYPGFPTDLQPLMMILLAHASGPSILTENVFEGRFLFVDELNRMGAQIRVEGHHAVVRGVEQLSAAPVRVPDIRAGAALALGALCARGTTELYDEGHIERGYERFDEKLRGLGASIRIEDLGATD